MFEKMLGTFVPLAGQLAPRLEPWHSPRDAEDAASIPLQSAAANASRPRIHASEGMCLRQLGENKARIEAL